MTLGIYSRYTYAIQVNEQLHFEPLNYRHTSKITELIEKNRDSLSKKFAWAKEYCKEEECDLNKKVKAWIGNEIKNSHHKEKRTFVLFYEGHPCGLMDYKKIERLPGLVFGIWLDKRVQNFGYGSLFLHSFERYLAFGFSGEKLHVLTTEDNVRMRAIAQKMEYSSEHHVRLRNVDYLHFSKVLSVKNLVSHEIQEKIKAVPKLNFK